GLVTSWAPTDRVRASFLAAFPEAIDIGGSVMIGGAGPITIDPDLWRQRVFAPATVAYLGGPRASAVWGDVRPAGPAAAAPADPAGTRLKRDLFPRDEFNSPD